MARPILNRVILPALIVVIALLQYANTIGNQFAWDDSLVIVENDYTQRGIGGLRDIFTKRVSVPYKNVYRPIPQAAYAVEYQLFGGSPHWMHFSSVLWYAACCLTIFVFLRYVLPNVHPVFVFAVTLLFVVHPLHVEVVANIKSRDEIMALLFGLWSLMFCMLGFEQKKMAYLFAAAACCAAALLSKQNVVSLLPLAAIGLWFRQERLSPTPSFFLALAVVLYFLGAYFRQPILGIAGVAVMVPALWKRPLGRLAVIASIVAVVLVSWLGIPVSEPAPSEALRLDSSVLNNIFLWTTESEKVLPTAIANIGRYLQLFLYPHPLIHLYGYDQISLRGWVHPSTLAVIGLLALGAAYLRANWKAKRPGVLGLLLFILSYSVYSNIVVLAPDTMADRYLFIPSLGLCLLLVESLFRLGRVSLEKPSFAGVRPKVLVAIFSIVVSGFFLRSWIANGDWYDDETLITSRIAYMPRNAAAHANMGMIHLNKSVEAATRDEHESLRNAAMESFKRALDIYPDFHWVWVSVGQIMAERGDFEKAELAFLKAQRLEPFSPDGYYSMGALYSLVGDREFAITYLERSLLLDPYAEETYVLLGKLYLQNDDMDNLRSMADAARRWFPQRAEFDAFLAVCLLNSGEQEKAGTHARAALKKDADNELALSVLLTISAADQP